MHLSHYDTERQNLTRISTLLLITGVTNMQCERARESVCVCARVRVLGGEGACYLLVYISCGSMDIMYLTS